jgi:hypothetical protein
LAYNSHPQPTGYRPLVFSFEEGNKDLLHFPSYSFLEWLPNRSGAKISFLITKMKPKPEQDALVKPPATPAPKAVSAAPSGATPSGTPNASTPNTTGFAQTLNTQPFQLATSSTPATFVPQPRIEDFDEKNDITDVDFYQPVTVLMLTDNQEIRNALVRAIRPPDVVERYMDEIFDKCKRANETYLAFRLPRDGEVEAAEKRVRIASTMGLSVSAADKKRGTGRPRRSLA